MCEQRRRNQTDDLLSRLIVAEVDGERLTERGRSSRSSSYLCSPGRKTTANLLNNAVLCLLDHPAECELLRGEPRFARFRPIEEVLRFPGRRSSGRCGRRCRMLNCTGVMIPQGAFVLPMVGAGESRSCCVSGCRAFSIFRVLRIHIWGFGHGIHFCLGAALARLEARIAAG